MDHTLQVNRSGEQVTTELIDQLERHGLHVMLTFNLQLARTHQVDCRCPHHETEQCACQYAVLFVHDPQQRQKISRTITIHGQDEMVWLSLLKSSTPSSQPGAEFEQKLLTILLSLADLATPVLKVDEPV